MAGSVENENEKDEEILAAEPPEGDKLTFIQQADNIGVGFAAHIV